MGVFGPRQVIMAAFSAPSKSALPDASFIMAADSLTPAEARVALSIAQGRTLKQTAQEIGVEVTGGRTQLDHVFRKTATSKQSELVVEFYSLTDMRVDASARLT